MPHALTGWKRMSWGNLATLEYGKGLRGYQNSGGQYPVFGTNGQIGWHSECLCPSEGVIVGRKGAYRGIHYSNSPFFVIDTAFYLKPIVDDSFSTKWAYYQLLDFDINKMDSGSAIPSTSRDAFYAIQLDVPLLPTQRKIAAILSAYDDLIENNLRRIKILEEMAQTLYREWFVNFGFPGHQQVRFVDSSLGKIPEGWKLVSISDVAIIHRGRSYKGTELADEGGRPFINLKCMERDGGFRSSGLKRYTGLFKDSQTVRAGEMVMAITDMTQERRIVARIGRVAHLDADFGVVSMDLVRIASRGNLSETYLYAMFRWSGFADEVKQHANGANVLHLLPDRIEEYRFVCPTSDVATRFGEIVLPMLSLCDSLEQKNTTLRRTRDLLLPRLISGEVDVSELDITIPEEENKV